eukprot:TRINITY_DN19809_c0_g1_i1.p1 TRINITY_DN19809_c0_g1~~TRINITY_DN19809_c0_g1_i1.p1  ORF type:complete len:201 (+),score=61.39 TRINITY_DN19809_c0_g1_i1:34-603(+)
MFLFEWFQSLLYQLGFFSKDATVLLLGLDNAGKTTLVHKLKYGEVKLFIPTQRAQLEEIMLGRVRFRAWDLGGHEAVRSLWNEYFFETDAVIFMVDASDRSRFEEAREELHELMKDENLARTPFLILGNKEDITGAVSRQELIGALELPESELGNNSQYADLRSAQVFMCSLVEGTGVAEAIDWLSDCI